MCYLTTGENIVLQSGVDSLRAVFIHHRHQLETELVSKRQGDSSGINQTSMWKTETHVTRSPEDDDI